MTAMTDVPTLWPKAVLFDLDGTLIDSAADLAAAANELLARDGLGPLKVAQVRGMVGDGIRKLVERAYVACGEHLSPEVLDMRHAAMMQVYGRHLTNLTTLMPGARDILPILRWKGVRTAVVTNKPEAFSRTILDHFGLMAVTDLVIGGDCGLPRKPAPDMLLHAAEIFGLMPPEVLMVGDGPADIAAAKAAGMPSAAVAGGYTPVPAAELGADRVLATLADLGKSLVA